MPTQVTDKWLPAIASAVNGAWSPTRIVVNPEQYVPAPEDLPVAVIEPSIELEPAGLVKMAVRHRFRITGLFPMPEAQLLWRTRSEKLTALAEALTQTRGFAEETVYRAIESIEPSPSEEWENALVVQMEFVVEEVQDR